MYAIKRELKLNNREVSQMRGNAGFKRFVYNFGLEMLIASWDFSDIKASDSVRLEAIKKVFTNHVMTNPEYAWTNNYPSTVYQSAFQDLGSALARWRKGLAQFPQKKSKKKGDSFTVYKTSGQYTKPKGGEMIPFTNRVVVQPGKRINLPGLKEFRLKEKIEFLCSSQTFTISRQADRWFVSFTIDAEKIPPIIHPVERVGIDLGVKTFATLSDESIISAPKILKIAKTKLSKFQWRNRNKKMGNRANKERCSSNAKKFFESLSIKHASIANIRYDFLQKTTTSISLKYYLIRLEDINVSGMLANHKLAEAISSLGFYEFRRQLVYKQRMYGTKVEIVDRWFPSSKTCSHCGHKQDMKLSDRVFHCGKCNFQMDRDLNAAINLLNAPQSQIVKEKEKKTVKRSRKKK